METQLPRTKKKKKGTSDKTALKNIFSCMDIHIYVKKISLKLKIKYQSLTKFD